MIRSIVAASAAAVLLTATPASAATKKTELTVSSVHSGQQSVMSTNEPFDELVLYQFHLQG